jgi:phosphoribosyl 1,2-cyclic phosphodiesterase
MADSVKVLFWGTRGSAPCFSGDKVRFGTNTSSVEVRWSAKDRILFDAGTGIIALGNQIHKGDLEADRPLHLFLSHFHWDHVHGLPFFKPAYNNKNHIVICGRQGVRKVFTGQLMAPFSPIPLEALTARIDYVRLRGPIEVGDALVEPFDLNHPQGCFGYAVTVHGKRIVYATDTEPDGGPMDALLAARAREADCLIMDSNNSLEEAKERRGWGHSTWRDCVSLAKKAGVRSLVLFHNDPFHDDRALLRKERLAQKRFPEALTAYDGLVMTV